MSIPTDPLAEKVQPPDRLFFATGVLLDAEDFKAEQLYHRGRLSRALAYLHGYGTVAGLKVEWQPPLAAGADPAFPDGREEQLLVQPGLALDRLGRLVEVPRSACIRLDRWYKSQPGAELRRGFHATSAPGVIVDLFIQFMVCERGKTPAFAAGPFAALDAVAPSRLRDGYELTLVIRQEETPNLPADPWQTIDPNADPEVRRAALRDAIFAAWHEGTVDWDDNGPVPPLTERVPGLTPSALLLARLTLPASAGTPPVRTVDAAVQVQNDVRRFVYPTAALARWLGI